MKPVVKWIAVFLLPLTWAFFVYYDSSATPQQTAEFADIIIFTFLLVAAFALFNLVRLLPLYRPSKLQLTDVSHENRPLPPTLHEWYRVLLEGKFRALGQVIMTGQTDPVWLFVDETETTSASLSPKGGGLFNLRTVFADIAAIETAFPNGMKMKRPDYRSMVGSGSVDETIHQHLQSAGVMQLDHGSPLTVRTVAEYIHLFDRYLEKHGRSGRMGRGRRVISLLTVYAWYLLIWFIVLRVLVTTQGGLTPTSTIVMGLSSLPPVFMMLGAAGIRG